MMHDPPARTLGAIKARRAGVAVARTHSHTENATAIVRALERLEQLAFCAFESDHRAHTLFALDINEKDHLAVCAWWSTRSS